MNLLRVALVAEEVNEKWKHKKGTSSHCLGSRWNFWTLFSHQLGSTLKKFSLLARWSRCKCVKNCGTQIEARWKEKLTNSGGSYGNDGRTMSPHHLSVKIHFPACTLFDFWFIIISPGVLTRCKLMGAVALAGGGATYVCLFWISSGLSANSMSSSTSLPFVSPRSYHSTVTDRWAGFSFDTIAEWTRPETKVESCAKLISVKEKFSSCSNSGFFASR